MPAQSIIATSQRRTIILEAVRRLSKTRSWVTQRDILADLRGQGFDVQKHHVLRDLKALALIHQELECHDESREDGKPRRGVEYGYRWIAKDSPPETGLSIPEALSLVLVSRYLKEALPNTLAGALDRLFDQAELTLNVQQKNGVTHWKELVGVVTPAQPMLPPKVKGEVLQVIHQALIAKEQFRGVYRNAKGEEEERVLNPLGIMVRSPSTYLVATGGGQDEPRMYAMHRFLSARRDYTPAELPTDFSLSDYLEQQGNFGRGMWVTLNARVNRNLGMILEETPLGSSQRLGCADDGGWRSLEVKVRDNWQLRWWLLAQGHRIIVEAPTELRAVLVTNAEFMAKEYLKTPSDGRRSRAG